MIRRSYSFYPLSPINAIFFYKTHTPSSQSHNPVKPNHTDVSHKLPVSVNGLSRNVDICKIGLETREKYASCSDFILCSKQLILQDFSWCTFAKMKGKKDKKKLYLLCPWQHYTTCVHHPPSGNPCVKKYQNIFIPLIKEKR